MPTSSTPIPSFGMIASAAAGLRDLLALDGDLESELRAEETTQREVPQSAETRALLHAYRERRGASLPPR